MHDVAEVHEIPASSLFRPFASGPCGSTAQLPAAKTSIRFWYTPALVRNVPTVAQELDEGHETESSSLRPEPWSGLGVMAHTLAARVSISARSTPELT